MTDTLTVARRFCGPPTSGNGGYVSGLVAGLVGGPATVTLKAPPPLDTALRVERGADGVRVFDGEREIASGVAAEPIGEAPPAAPTTADAETGAERYLGFKGHVFPTCFVCGPDRGAGDGLRIFAGAVEGGDLVAAPWVPDASLDAGDGRAREEFAWAALDCPSYFAFRTERLPAVLGRITAEVTERPRLGEACVVAAWPIAVDGRKKHSGSALYGADGRLLAQARATWIELKEPLESA